MRFIPLETRDNYNDKSIGRPYIFENPYFNQLIDGDSDGFVMPDVPY